MLQTIIAIIIKIAADLRAAIDSVLLPFLHGR